MSVANISSIYFVSSTYLNRQHSFKDHGGTPGQHFVCLLGHDILEVFEGKLDILDEAVGGLGSAQVARHRQVVRGAGLLRQHDGGLLRPGLSLRCRHLPMLYGIEEVLLKGMSSGGEQPSLLLDTVHDNYCLLHNVIAVIFEYSR